MESTIYSCTNKVNIHKTATYNYEQCYHTIMKGVQWCVCTTVMYNNGVYVQQLCTTMVCMYNSYVQQWMVKIQLWNANLPKVAVGLLIKDIPVIDEASRDAATLFPLCWVLAK